MLPTCYRQLVPAAFALAALGGCSAAGEANGERTLSDRDLPFTFRVPSEFTEESVDDFDSRGDVLVAAGIDKVDVIAARRIPTGARVPRGDVPHRVQGQAVTSRLHAFTAGGERWGIECQWRDEHRKKVLAACDTAVRSITPR